MTALALRIVPGGFVQLFPRKVDPLVREALAQRRDYLSAGAAAALPLLDFAEASDPQEGYGPQEVCRVTIPPSTRPVYLKGPKGKGEAELWVRVGNSTRRLEVADAVQYVAARWPETVRVSPLNRARLFFTLRRHRDTPTRLPRVVERVLTERAKHGASGADGE